VGKQIAADPASTAAVLALVAAGVPVYYASASLARSAHRADR
jgi:hypothetical protein